MKTELQYIPILSTKLHRPQVPAGYLHRPELLERLEEVPRPPLVLVSAPAGYGKSTLATSWLEGNERPYAWVSLDKDDNHLHRFLSYFVAALQTIFPEALDATTALIKSPVLPPISVLNASLINDLEQIGQDFILVLDDIHLIREKAILDFLKTILHHPARSMQLCLVGRRDPIVPIVSMRAKGMIREIRMQDLQFTSKEAGDFLEKAMGLTLEKAIKNGIVEKTEGWITGLRLAVLAMRGQNNPGRNLLGIKGTTRYIVDYLLGEVLDQQPSEIKDYLLNVSILDRFCAPLCDALYEKKAKPAEKTIDGQSVIAWLQANNLFIIPLDMENHWFRFHHLFKDLLKNRLKHAKSQREINTLFSRAGVWCEGQTLVEDAIGYTLAAGDDEAAADIVERYRDREFDNNRWYVVDRWLERLPEVVTRKRIKLLLTEARVLNDRFRLMDIPPVIERAQVLMAKQSVDPLDRGECYYFLGFLQFWQGDGRKSRMFLDKALELVPESHIGYVRAQIELFIGLTDYINGKKDEAIQVLHGWIDKRHLQSGQIWERLKFGLVTIHLLAGELAPAHREGRILLDAMKRSGQVFVETWADYFLGVGAFHRFALSEAQHHFGRVLANQYAANMRAVVDSYAGMAICLEFQEHTDEADQILHKAEDFVQWAEDPMLLDVVLACKARIALLRGNLDAAIHWQRGFKLPAHVPGMIFFFVQPNITACRILTATGTKAAITEAAENLQHLRQETESLHYTCHVIEIVVLQTMVAHGLGRSEESFDFLEHAVSLSEPGGWIRPFVEMGAPMAGLLEQLLKQNPSAGHIRKILAAFPGHQYPGTSRVNMGTENGGGIPSPLIDPLTHREQDVLELLCERLQNKEIAEKLFVSNDTVKWHLKAIYQKLQVNSRRQAVEQARHLGIIH